MNTYTKYTLLKSVIENVLGSDAWYALKESNHLPTWKKQLIKVIDAIHVSIQASIEVYDQDWIEEINQVVETGIKEIKMSEDIEESISSLAATFINISFIQVGLMPRRKGKSKVSLRKENWELNIYRSVIYIQSFQQKEELFWDKQQDEIGFREQLELKDAHRISKSKLPYSEWCIKMSVV
jgi:hypothetical protein